MSERVSLKSQIAAIEVVTNGRTGGLHAAGRELHAMHLQAAIETLRWVQRHEATVRDAVKRAGEPL